MEVDEVLSKLGTFGKWQIISFNVLSIATMFPTAFHMLSIIYIGYKPDHHCRLQPKESVNESIPIGKENGRLSSCSRYIDQYNHSLGTEKCIDGWIYRGNDGPTIVTEWNLVCERGFVADLSQTILVSGSLLGAIVLTRSADIYGRKRVFLFSQWALVLVGTCLAFVTHVYVFLLLRFLSGFLQQAILITGFVMICELFSAKHRSFAGLMVENYWAAAWCLMPLMAYLIPNWRHLQLFFSLFGLITVPLYWYISESVIWLTANKQFEEAETILRKAAKMNKIDLPSSPYLYLKGPDILENSSEVHLLKTNRSNIEDGELGYSANATKSIINHSALDLFRNRRLRLFTTVTSCLWMVVALVYYGLSLSSAKLFGSRFLNAFVNGFVEIPAYTSSYFIINRFGRRRPMLVYNLIAGVSLLLCEIIPYCTGNETSLRPLITTLNMVGKFGITGNFGILCLFVPELYPSTLRNQAMGVCSGFGIIGSILATFTPYIIEHIRWLPGVVFGTMSIIGGFLVLLLPETKDRPLPPTLEHIEDWYHGKNEYHLAPDNNQPA